VKVIVTGSAAAGGVVGTTAVSAALGASVALAGVHAARIPAPLAKPAIFMKSRLFIYFFIILSPFLEKR
jgi:hypothetical protein